MSGTESRTSRRGLLIVSAMLVAAMGWYVMPGLRTEQLAVYGIGAVLLPFTVPLIRLQGPLLATLALWATYVVVVVVGAAAPPMNRSGYDVSPGAFAGLDNALLPLFILLIVLGLVALDADPRRLLWHASAVIVLLACVNAVAAIMQFQGLADWSAWYGFEGIETVSDRAEQHGRYSGLLNHPAEAGVFYSLAGLCAVYRFRHRPGWLILGLTAVLIGGVLTVSKVFLLGGLPIMLIILLRGGAGRPVRLFATGAVALAGWAVVVAGILPEWIGVDRLRTLIPGPTDSFVRVISASRYGGPSGGTTSDVVDAVLFGPWAFGYGGRGLLVAYDSGWVEALVAAGVVGLVLHALVFVALVRAWSTMARSPERELFGAVILMLAGASLGLPSFTANRVATFVWIILGLLLTLAHQSAHGRLNPQPSRAAVAHGSVRPQGVFGSSLGDVPASAPRTRASASHGPPGP